MVTVSTGDGRWRLVPKAPFSSLIQVHNGAKFFLLFFVFALLTLELCWAQTV